MKNMILETYFKRVGKSLTKLQDKVLWRPKVIVASHLSLDWDEESGVEISGPHHNVEVSQTETLATGAIELPKHGRNGVEDLRFG